MSDATTPSMSQQGLIVYKGMIDQFDFLKKQQWATTNYVVLIYAALVWIGQHVEHSPKLTCILSAVAIVTGFVATGLLVWFQYDLGNLRLRVRNVDSACFSTEEQKAFDLTPYKHPYGRGWHVLTALILVCLFGAGLVVWVLYATPRGS